MFAHLTADRQNDYLLLDRINEQHEGGNTLGAKVGPVRDRAEMQGEGEMAGRPPDCHGAASDGLRPAERGGMRASEDISEWLGTQVPDCSQNG